LFAIAADKAFFVAGEGSGRPHQERREKSFPP
jgi:hypothetical protein